MATTALGQATHGVAGYEEKSGFWSWITTVDHKRVAILYGISALTFFLLGGV